MTLGVEGGGPAMVCQFHCVRASLENFSPTEKEKFALPCLLIYEQIHVANKCLAFPFLFTLWAVVLLFIMPVCDTGGCGSLSEGPPSMAVHCTLCFLSYIVSCLL